MLVAREAPLRSTLAVYRVNVTSRNYFVWCLQYIVLYFLQYGATEDVNSIKLNPWLKERNCEPAWHCSSCNRGLPSVQICQEKIQINRFSTSVHACKQSKNVCLHQMPSCTAGRWNISFNIPWFWLICWLRAHPSFTLIWLLVGVGKLMLTTALPTPHVDYSLFRLPL